MCYPGGLPYTNLRGRAANSPHLNRIAKIIEKNKFFCDNLSTLTDIILKFVKNPFLHFSEIARQRTFCNILISLRGFSIPSIDMLPGFSSRGISRGFISFHRYQRHQSACPPISTEFEIFEYPIRSMANCDLYTISRLPLPEMRSQKMEEIVQIGQPYPSF
jgi:hypothetical protein